MKKLFSAILCFLLVFSLFGCSNNPNEQTESKTSTQKLEVSLLKDGKFVVTCEQFIHAYEKCLNEKTISIVSKNEDNKGYDYDIHVNSVTTELSFSKSGGEKKKAESVNPYEIMDTIAISYTGVMSEYYLTQAIYSFDALIWTLNPDMDYGEASDILSDIIYSLKEQGNNMRTAQKEVNGVTYSLLVVSNLMCVFTASVDPNVTINPDNNTIADANV